jgi:hypothetical protein
MRSHGYRQNRSGRVERRVLRTVLLLGLAAAVGLWYGTREAGEGVSLGLTGLTGLTVVAGVNWFGRVRSRQRWEAAWDAYATGETDDDFVEMTEEDAELCLAGGR